ncbi:KilA-N domain-containing protein [Sodalis glossinidius]|uniref:KilA-N domain-containing protein n=1 Tax=Sodalis glossinidius TaxID=63612 RepID=UPI00067FF30D|nr:KilA-N domain-containing protein [Sodalis glossinidius]
MSKLVVIENTVVRQDVFGRYCLNDLHKAAGGLEKDKPKFWLANEKTGDLIAQFVSEGGNPPSVIRVGSEQGTYVAKELVFAYAVDAPEGSATGSSEVTHSLTELLALHGKPSSVQSGYRRLAMLAIVERKSRPSSKHPDKEKLFWSLTEKGLQFGKNLTDPNNPRQAQPHFYDAHFPRLLAVMMNEAPLALVQSTEGVVCA